MHKAAAQANDQAGIDRCVSCMSFDGKAVHSMLMDVMYRESGRVPQQGSIVNCASVNSMQAGVGTSGYTAAKHGVPGITKAVSLVIHSY